jgi:hypothetical protein
MSRNPPLPQLRAETRFTPHGSIAVEHADGWTQIFVGYPATILQLTELIDGKEKALDLAKTVMKPLAVKAYYPEGGQIRWRERMGEING